MPHRAVGIGRLHVHLDRIGAAIDAGDERLGRAHRSGFKHLAERHVAGGLAVAAAFWSLTPTMSPGREGCGIAGRELIAPASRGAADAARATAKTGGRTKTAACGHLVRGAEAIANQRRSAAGHYTPFCGGTAAVADATCRLTCR